MLDKVFELGESGKHLRCKSMVQEFLNYIDEVTNFGLIHITGERLFEMFVAKKHLTPNIAYGFRLRLQAKGIL
jgi:hypothetical protein